ncbi:hypothetical protein QVD17_17856 [Tagetes erecta]|uniref:Uncharacterized protein n=1 Tax=Tagetes erecta TaxID=13708 RepID=A0AAD8KJF1_TARER|nr:hypothetical protein QVD17_17856 [Tagetes erecta]
MECGGEGDGTSSCLMSFGDTNNININNTNNYSNNSTSSNSNNNIPSLSLPPAAAYTNNNLVFSNDHMSNINISGSAHDMMQGNNSIMNDGCVKAKIMSHPHYPRLLSAYLNCQKIGAPSEVVERLEEEGCRLRGMNDSYMIIGEDPSLDQFMEAYSEMLIKYEQELSKPFKEAMLFLSTIQSHFNTISSTSNSNNSPGGGMDKNGSSEEEVDNNNQLIDPEAEDRELKGELLRKYSGYLGSLKQEFMKKRKKGKLPKEARQQLLDWWTRHYKWPYPSEAQKLALAESTGLDQKQINNWFINQRKRHWKPSEDMQFVVMDAAAHPHHYFMDNMMNHPNYPMDVSLL